MCSNAQRYRLTVSVKGKLIKSYGAYQSAYIDFRCCLRLDVEPLPLSRPVSPNSRGLLEGEKETSYRSLQFIVMMYHSSFHWPVKFGGMCLQETWIDNDENYSLFNLPGYTCIFQGKRCSKRGGLVIYLNTINNYTRLPISNNFEK